MWGEPRHNGRSYRLAVAITIGLCAVWGLAHGLRLRIDAPFFRFFELSPLHHYLASASSSITYVIVALPAALFLRRLGYKLAIVFGLGAFSLGAFLLYPAVAQHQVLWYVAAVIATSTGWCFLETSANPLICIMGSPRTAVQRLNFAQAFYPVGYVAALHFSSAIALPRAGMLDAQLVERLVQPYILAGLAVMLVTFLIETVEFPAVALVPSHTARKPYQELRTLLLRREFQFALAAMCATMAGLVITVSLAGRYVAQVWPEGALAPNVSILFWTMVGIGRFSGAALMRRFDPLRVLVAAVAACVLMLCLMQFFQGLAGVASLFGAALFLSITFPTIFGEAIRNTGELTKSASGLLVVAAGLGALLAGNLAAWTIRAGYIGVGLTAGALCYVVVLVAALAILRLRREDPAAPEDWAVPSARRF